MAQGANAADPRLRRAPDLRSSYVRALLRGTRRPEVGALILPSAEIALDGVTIDPLRLDAYARVCGYDATARSGLLSASRSADRPASAASPNSADRPAPVPHIPAAYPHLLAFPALMALLTRPDFPLPLLGLVHVANRITVHRPLSLADPLDLALRLADLREHPRGTAFDAVIEAHVGGDLVWESTSTYLHRRAASQRQDTGADMPPPTSAEPVPAPVPAPAPAPDAAPTLPPQVDHAATQSWYIPSDTGRRYAAVSGDRNPIHLYPVTARLFGFPRHIAHGMCTLARVAATLEPLPAAYTLKVEFRAPIMLPATVRLTTTTTTPIAAPATNATHPQPTSAPPLDFTLTDADGTRVHLHGAVRAS